MKLPLAMNRVTVCEESCSVFFFKTDKREATQNNFILTVVVHSLTSTDHYDFYVTLKLAVI